MERGLRKPRLMFAGCWHHNERPKDCTVPERQRWEQAYVWCRRMARKEYHARLISDDLWLWLKRRSTK